jgi:uncharacterized protein with PIN domain
MINKIAQMSRVMNDALSLCPYCNCMTKTIVREILSASENRKYGYYCGKCKMNKLG